VDVTLDDVSVGAAYAVLPAIAVAGWLAATFRYRRADVD
jgi:multidrug transporter EmrE-like cation transporter